jgi:hypothetical protein
MKAIKVLVSIPNEGHTQVEAYANRMENVFALGKLAGLGEAGQAEPVFQFHIMTLGRMLTPLAREEAGKACLEYGMDYVFFIDDDMICPNDLFQQLWRHDVDIVAPLAFTRNYPHKAVIYQVTKGFDKVAQMPYFINHYIHKYPRNKLVQCDAVGFGAALIKRQVFEKTPKPWFMSTTATGEDIFFCYNAWKAGFKVYMDTSTKIGHLSHPPEITEEYVDRLFANQKDDQEKHFGNYPAELVSEPVEVPTLIRGEKWHAADPK